MKLYKKCSATDRAYVEATPEDVVTAFRELPQTTQMRASLTLPQRMREAAKVLREVDERTPEWDDPPWHPTTLCRMAARWEAEAARAVARDVAVEDLAKLRVRPADEQDQPMSAPIVAVGDLFSRDRIDTRPCVHCGAPAVDCGGRAMHFTVSASGGKAAWLECFELVRGRRKYTGTEARVAS